MTLFEQIKPPKNIDGISKTVPTDEMLESGSALELRRAQANRESANDDTKVAVVDIATPTVSFFASDGSAVSLCIGARAMDLTGKRLADKIKTPP